MGEEGRGGERRGEEGRGGERRGEGGRGGERRGEEGRGGEKGRCGGVKGKDMQKRDVRSLLDIWVDI